MNKETFFGLLLLASTVSVFLISDYQSAQFREMSKRRGRIGGALNNNQSDKKTHEAVKSAFKHKLEKLGKDDYKSKLQKYIIQTYAKLDDDMRGHRKIRITYETVESRQKLVKMNFKQGMILMNLSLKSRCIKDLEMIFSPLPHPILILNIKWRWKYFIEGESISYSKKYPTSFKELMFSKYVNEILRSKSSEKTSPRMMKLLGMQLMDKMIFGTRYSYQEKKRKHLKDVVFRN